MHLVQHMAPRTHLSSATGAIFMSKSKWQEEKWNAKKLTEHMQVYLQKKASDTESEAGSEERDEKRLNMAQNGSNPSKII